MKTGLNVGLVTCDLIFSINRRMFSKIQHCKLLLTILVSPLQDLVELSVPAVTFCVCARRYGAAYLAVSVPVVTILLSFTGTVVVTVSGRYCCPYCSATDSLPTAVSCTIIGLYHRLQKSLLFERRGISYGNKCYLGTKILH